jgi:uncharacterized membrane protein YwaF
LFPVLPLGQYLGHCRQSKQLQRQLFKIVHACNLISSFFFLLPLRPFAERLGRRNALIANGIVNIFGALMEFFAKPLGSPEVIGDLKYKMMINVVFNIRF